MGLQGEDYKIDIAFVIDATGSMGPIMASVKASALSLGDQIVKALEEAGKPVEQLRMRVIDFADYATEADDAIHQTDFYTMPADKQKFTDAINNIQYDRRGGDIPENALEALFIAMNSDWVPLAKGEKGRHIIIMMTDAYPLKLHERDGSMGYVADDFPSNVQELQNIWDAAGSQDATTLLSKKNRRLILFVPDGDDGAGHDWSDVLGWEKTLATIVDSGAGMDKIDIKTITEEIVRSAAD